MKWEMFKAVLLVTAAFGLIAVAVAHKPVKHVLLQHIEHEHYDANGNRIEGK